MNDQNPSTAPVENPQGNNFNQFPQRSGGNAWSIPLAIVVAGALIAGGIYFGSNKNSTANVGAAKPKITGEVRRADGNDHLLGNPNADIVVIEYSDLQCPYCQVMHKTIEEIMNSPHGKDGKVAWVFRHLPLKQIHPLAQKAAEASECAAEIGGNDKFWAFISNIFEDKAKQNAKLGNLPLIATTIGVDKAKFDECLASGKYASKVDKDLAEASKAGGRGTPYNIFTSKDKFKKDTLEEVSNLFAGYSADQSPLIYSDEKMVGISGALPKADMIKIIDILRQQ